MLKEFRKYVGYKILEFFLKNPTKKTYLKELAKILEISPRSVKIYCDIFEKDNLIYREVKGNYANAIVDTIRKCIAFIPHLEPYVNKATK